MHPAVQLHHPGVENVSFAGRRVLVVEDEFLVSLATTDLLESIGCVVVGPATCLLLALELAQAESLDAAVLDIDLAGERVWPVAEELHRRNIPFIFLSAYRPPDGAPEHICAAPHLEKPLAEVKLLRTLRLIWQQ